LANPSELTRAAPRELVDPIPVEGTLSERIRVAAAVGLDVRDRAVAWSTGLVTWWLGHRGPDPGSCVRGQPASPSVRHDWGKKTRLTWTRNCARRALCGVLARAVTHFAAAAV